MTSTLRGIFPEPKAIHPRNFVRENIRHLKEMQGYLQQEAKLHSESQIVKNSGTRVHNFKKKPREPLTRRPFSYNKLARPAIKTFYRNSQPIQKISHRGVQTDRPEDVPKLYETGVLKYPSPSTKSKEKTQDSGDAGLVKGMQKLELNDRIDHIKRNINNLKAKSKVEEVDPCAAPAGYQRGVVPKYLQEKKETTKEKKEEAPPTISPLLHDSLDGLVLLPDDERKEYLKVARENYARLIKELNAMPVSNDTLKRRKRKMEIEEELKRLDEVIKIFQKPKVFVKADT